jgi:thiosulfate/3-mercaptopyruvate sulfurtransferase
MAMDSLVSTQWLTDELGAADLRVLDASWHLPDAGRDAAGDYARGHIPGALFLDLGSLVDRSSPIDNTLPPASQFAARMKELGVSDTDRIVVYDDSAVKSAARAWFMLRMFGGRTVAILDGGLGKWKAEGRPLTAEVPGLSRGHFNAKQDNSGIRSMADMLANLDTGAEQVVDARGPGRFAGTDPEPRPGVMPGHIPGSRNLPFGKLFNADGTYKDEAGIRAAMAEAGVDPAWPTVVSCGSGVTACVLAFAMERIGKQDVAHYDGSWGEWGADPSTPKATGPA